MTVDLKSGDWVRILADDYLGSRGRILRADDQGALVEVHRLHGAKSNGARLRLGPLEFRRSPPPGG